MAFGAATTTDELVQGMDLFGRRVLITGASAGLGLETARALAAHGAEVVMAVRDLAKAQGAADTIGAATPTPAWSSANSISHL
jgi:NAD(P)-dependent dehydrogenase (short-subunit alcohol dehydrogenase family)